MSRILVLRLFYLVFILTLYLYLSAIYIFKLKKIAMLKYRCVSEAYLNVKIQHLKCEYFLYTPKRFCHRRPLLQEKKVVIEMK